MSINNTRGQEIAATLRDEILRQRYRSGDRLPSERELAARFEASRGAVREALSQLELLGLIRVQPGGARVQAVETASIGILGHLMAIDKTPDPTLVDQFLQTFGGLSCVTARSAVVNANAEQMNRLRETIVELTKHAAAGDALRPEWRELLETFAEVADNLVVRLIANDLKAQFVEQMSQFGIRPRLERRAVMHILDSLKLSLTNRDGDLAGAAVQQYFDGLRQAITAAIHERFGSYRKQAV